MRTAASKPSGFTYFDLLASDRDGLTQYIDPLLTFVDGVSRKVHYNVQRFGIQHEIGRILGGIHRIEHRNLEETTRYIHLQYTNHKVSLWREETANNLRAEAILGNMMSVQKR